MLKHHHHRVIAVFSFNGTASYIILKFQRAA